MRKFFKKNQRGAITLVISTILIVVMTLIIIFAANLNSQQAKFSANQKRAKQAFQAAEAGIEYGIVYLEDNYKKIATNIQSTGIYTDAGITNFSLHNGSHFSIVYELTKTNASPWVFNIVSTGISDDGITQLVIRQGVAGANQTNSYTGGYFYRIPGSWRDF